VLGRDGDVVTLLSCIVDNIFDWIGLYMSALIRIISMYALLEV